MPGTPIRTFIDPEKESREAAYTELLLSAGELGPQELLTRMTKEEAALIFLSLDSSSDIDDLRGRISDEAISCRINKAIYDDEVEDFIYEDETMLHLTDQMKKDGLHSSGEKVRLFRSARAALYYYDVLEFIKGWAELLKYGV